MPNIGTVSREWRNGRTVDLDESNARPGGRLQGAIERMAALDGRKACIARMRILGELSLDQIAVYLGLSPSIVREEWRFTRAWLAREVGVLDR